MTIHDTFEGAQYVTTIADMASAHGVTLRVDDDFHEFGRLVAEHRKGHPLGAPFDPEKQGVSSKNGFWIAGWNRDGELVHTQAMRRYHVPVSLADFLSRHFRDFPPAGVDLDLAKSRYTPGPGARRISGACVYHGEGWISGGETGFRGTGLFGALAKFAMATAMLRWSPDFVFGFMGQGHAYRGLMEREGYMHSEPGALFWRLAETGEDIHGLMAWMAREDLEYMMELPRHLLAA